MTTTAMHLAELNVGRLLAPTDDPRVAEFIAALEWLASLRAPSDSDRAFGCAWLKDARLWRTHGCSHVAAE
jgi:hypothetical protein